MRKNSLSAASSSDVKSVMLKTTKLPFDFMIFMVTLGATRAPSRSTAGSVNRTNELPGRLTNARLFSEYSTCLLYLDASVSSLRLGLDTGDHTFLLLVVAEPLV